MTPVSLVLSKHSSHFFRLWEVESSHAATPTEWIAYDPAGVGINSMYASVPCIDNGNSEKYKRDFQSRQEFLM